MRSYKQPTSEETARQGGHVVEMQRRRLLLAFVEVVAEQGLENASVGRVCKRAGVSRRTFYELFDDRDECLLAAFDAAIERISRPVLAAWAEGGKGVQTSTRVARDARRARDTQGAQTWLVRIRGALTVLLEQLDAEPDVARLCVVETLKAGPLVSERRARVLAALVAAVEHGRTPRGTGGETRRGSEPPPLTGQGVVGGALSVIHARLLACHTRVGGGGIGEEPSNGRLRPLSADPRLGELTGELMAMIVHPYLGAAAARRELERPTPKTATAGHGAIKDPFKDLPIRFTYRTARVLATIAANSGASNRLVADSSGIADEGQTSRLLARLQRAGLIDNRGEGRAKGEANAWALTERGEAVHTTLAG